MTISVFLLDDHEIVRRGIAQLLETEDDIEITGEAGTAAQAMARIPALRPDVAILDVRLPDGEGISVCRELRSSITPPPACLMLTSYLDDEALFGAIIAGAAGTADTARSKPSVRRDSYTPSGNCRLTAVIVTDGSDIPGMSRPVPERAPFRGSCPPGGRLPDDSVRADRSTYRLPDPRCWPTTRG